MSGQGTTDDDDGASLLLIAKHKGTGRYATFDASHLDQSQDAVRQKLDYLATPKDD